jgi:hypothetical protein
MSAGAAGGPMDPWTLPDEAARRSLTFHLVYGGALVALVIGAVNVVLGWYILRPVALMRQRLTGLQRGHWRGPVDPGGNDEIGTLYEGFQRLGPEMDALVAHILHAERLAMLALRGAWRGAMPPRPAKMARNWRGRPRTSCRPCTSMTRCSPARHAGRCRATRTLSGGRCETRGRGS